MHFVGHWQLMMWHRFWEVVPDWPYGWESGCCLHWASYTQGLEGLSIISFGRKNAGAKSGAKNLGAGV